MFSPPTGARLAARLPLIGAAVCAAGLLLSWPASASGQPDASPAPAHMAPGKGKSVQLAQAPVRTEARPAWSELNGEQRAALRPLGPSWASLSEAQKRKWIALSRNFGRMSPQQQAKLHSRMDDWVALSPQQRTQARLNFGETRGLSPDDKRAKWEAYQALSPEEKRKLAAGANAPRTPPTAAAVRPVPAQKLANIPRAERRPKPARIASTPGIQAQPTASEPGGTD